MHFEEVMPKLKAGIYRDKDHGSYWHFTFGEYRVSGDNFKKGGETRGKMRGEQEGWKDVQGVCWCASDRRSATDRKRRTTEVTRARAAPARRRSDWSAECHLGKRDGHGEKLIQMKTG